MNIRNVLCLLLCVWQLSLLGSTSASLAGVTFDRAICAADGELFGAQSAVVGSPAYAVTRLSVERQQDGSYVSTLVPLVAPQACVNNAIARSENDVFQYRPVFSESPLYGQYVGILSAYKNYPLIAFGPDDSSPLHSVAMVTDLAAGSSILTNKLPFGDALGAVARNIVALAGGFYVRQSTSPNVTPVSFGLVFAAVTPSDASAFAGQAGAGIAVAQIVKDGIEPIDALGRNRGPQAVPLTNALMQIGTDGAGISGVNALCWNETLGRLYVALTTTSGSVAVAVGVLAMPADAKVTGAAVPNLMCIVRPCIADNNGVNLAENWTDDDYIVASAAQGTAIQALDVMNASTGKDYLVVFRDDSSLYAVPLTAGGVLAAKTDNTVVATQGSSAQLYTTSDVAALVGAGAAPAAVTAMHVEGDSVFISCAGGVPGEQGVFVSQALFDISGAVVRWSPWEPAAAANYDVYGFSRDKLGRMKFLSGDQDTFFQQLWGSAQGNGLWGGSSDNPGAGLVAQVNQYFPAASGGVQAVVSTSSGVGSHWYATSPRLASGVSLLSFTGRDRYALALVSSGSGLTTGTDFSSVNNFWTYDFAAHGLSMGVLTTAAISASTSSSGKGWIFVGGSNGVAVLCQDGGAGWSTLSSLSTIASGYVFAKLKKADGTDFSQVTQVLTDSANFYVVCADGVYRCPYSATNFANGLAGETLIATPAVLLGAPYETILSMAIVGSYALLGTTQGLWINDGPLVGVANTVGAGGWNELLMTPSTTENFGVCSQLFFMPAASSVDGGMLYVLAADVALNVASVYRVRVQGGTLDSAARATMGATVHTCGNVARLYMTLPGQFREYFYTDGGVVIDASSRHHAFTAEGSGMFRVLPVSSSIGNMDAWSQALQPVFDNGIITDMLSGVVRDPATGTVIVPGTWGIQVLQ